MRLIGNIQWLRGWRILRFALGVTVLGSVLWISLPISTATTGSMCTLACCAGRAAHAAGSCMNGSCHAFLAGNHKKNHVHQKSRVESVEKLCGMSRIARNATRFWFVQMVTTANSNDAGAPLKISDHVSVTTAFTKPCQPECGGCVSGYASSKRRRNFAALAFADRPRPPSGIRLGKSDFGAIQTLNAKCRHGAPRGPPLSFS
jgi:hypothetical protein